MAKIGFNDINIIGSDALIKSYARENYSKLTRNSATEFQCEAQDALRNYLVIAGEIVSLSSVKTCTVSGAGVHNLIAADGTDSSGAPSASTLYYAYLSNSSASFAASSCRLSATAPTNLYLAASGNGANWRFVGAVQLDGSTQIADSFAICGYGKSVFELDLGVQINRSSGSSAFYDVLVIANCVFLAGTKFQLISQISNSVISTGILTNKLFLASDEVARGQINNIQYHCVPCSYTANSAAIQSQEIKSQYYYTSGLNQTILISDPKTFIIVERETI